MLAPDKTTIVESFALSYHGVLPPKDVNAAASNDSEQDLVRAHWEFVRRYMEDGPEAVADQIEFCMPLDGRRETAKGGMHRIFANFAGGSWIMIGMMAPICLLVSLARVVAMRTSKIPRWPQHVEAACEIEEGDPYAIAGDADGHRIAVYPEAARATGVLFAAAKRQPARRNESR